MATKLFDTDNVGLGGDPHAHRSRPTYKGDWYSGKGYDLLVPPGTSVYSLTDGKIQANNEDTANCEKGVYGNRVTILTNDGDQLYYTHINSDLIPNKTIKKGDLVGKVTQDCSNIVSHLHIASQKKDIRNYVDFKTWAIVGGGSSLANKDQDQGDQNLKNKNFTQPDRTQGSIADFYRTIGQKLAIPAALATLPALASVEKLQEQIQRIKNLM